jgi:hypothetical protein
VQKTLSIPSEQILYSGVPMPIKTWAALLPALLLWVTAASSETLPSDVTFSRPRITDEITKLVLAAKAPHASEHAPAQATPGAGVEAPMPIFRTLAEAAQAGISPGTPPEKLITEPDLRFNLPVEIRSNDKPDGKALWPAAFGAISLLACGFIAFVAMVTMHLHPRPLQTTE